LSEDTLTRARRVLGEDQPDPLKSAVISLRLCTNSANTGKPGALNEDILARARRVLGVDDPDTLTAAHYLAVTLLAVGENEEARVLLEDTETRR